MLDWFAPACRIPGMVIVAPAVRLLAQQALVPVDDISGQTPVSFFLLFVIGFVMLADNRITAAVDRQWWWAPAAGAPATAGAAARAARSSCARVTMPPSTPIWWPAPEAAGAAAGRG